MSNDVRKQSVRMRRAVTVLWSFCLLLVLGERFSAAAIELFRTELAPAAVRHFGCELVSALPEALFLLGLWWVRAALAAFAKGELFAASITTMLDRVGIVLAVGSLARIAIVPGVCSVLGENPGYWIAFDAASLVLAALGLALKAIATVLRHASAIQTELDEIF